MNKATTFFFAGMAFLLFFATVSHAQTIKVATIERKPFSFKIDDEWTGFSIQLWEKIAKEIGFSTEYVEADSFPQMLEMVKLGEVTLAAANISVTAERERVLDFTQPIFDSGLTILARADTKPSIFGVLRDLQLWTWILGAIGLFFVAGILIAIAERKHPHLDKRDNYDRLREGFWWSVSVVTNASFTIFTPVTAAGRLISYLLIIVGLFVVSAFVAQITASLTVQELRSSIVSLNDLRDKRVGTTNGSTSSRYLTTQAIDHVAYDTLDMLYDGLRNNDIQAIVHDAPLLQYFSKTEGQGEFKTVGPIFKPEKYGFTMPQNSLQESG